MYLQGRIKFLIAVPGLFFSFTEQNIFWALFIPFNLEATYDFIFNFFCLKNLFTSILNFAVCTRINPALCMFSMKKRLSMHISMSSNNPLLFLCFTAFFWAWTQIRHIVNKLCGFEITSFLQMSLFFLNFTFCKVKFSR